MLAKIRAGVPAPIAAQSCGRSWNTVKQWIQRGRNAEVDANDEAINPADAPFVRFMMRYEAARADAVAIRVGRINKAAKNGDAKLDIWWLEKRTAAFRTRAPRRDADELPALPPGEAGTRTILVYPVPMPLGADPRTYALPTGHALESIDIIDTEGGDSDDE